MTEPRLSICIPTFNFGRFLGQTLNSVVDQAEDNVEIVVVDGASTDDTRNVVEKFMDRCDGITYYRRDQNMGVDRDLAKAVELARGTYCWLMSADDVLVPGGLSHMVRETEGEQDIYLCNRILCDANLHPIAPQFWLGRATESRVFDLSNREQLHEYLKLARSVGALFSFISSIVVRRKRWLESICDESFVGSNYAHVQRLFEMPGPRRIKYVRDPIVFCRGDNDSFLRQGRVRRFLIDLQAYERVADMVCGEDATLQAKFRRIMRREHRWYKWIRVRGELGSSEEWASFRRHLERFGYSKWSLWLIERVGNWPIAVRLAHAGWRISRSMSRRWNQTYRGIRAARR